MSSDLSKKILKLSSTRVWRTYYGGAEIEKWQGIAQPHDGQFPEDWIASTVRATNPGREQFVEEGLSAIVTTDGGRILLRHLIESDPAAFLGADHFKKYGVSMSILAKVIDSLGRLTIQVHPDKQFAKTVLSSDYGKTEAWYIFGGRIVDGQKPYVLLGFKPGMTREKWKSLFDAQDIEGMLNSLHKIEVKPGDVFLIEGGVPHAIGSGCLLIEIQEPTDYTIRVERCTPEGNIIPDLLCHQGAGFDRMFDSFHYDSFTLEETLSRWKIKPKLCESGLEFEEWSLIDEESTKLFEMRRLIIRKKITKNFGGTFAVLVVIKGEGSINGGGECLMAIRQGDMIFVPASLGEVVIDASQEIEIVICLPPKRIKIV